MSTEKKERKYPKTLVLLSKDEAKTRVHKRDVKHYESKGWKVVK